MHKVLLSLALIEFLQKRGYTHFQLSGILPKEEWTSQEINQDDYILVPWKKEVTLFEDAKLQLEEIGSTDIMDMLDVEFGIEFWVLLPEELADAYQLKQHTD